MAIAPLVIGGVGGYLIARGYFKGAKEESIAKTSVGATVGMGILGAIITGLIWELTRE